MTNFNKQDHKNYLIAIILSSLVFFLWAWLFQPSTIGQKGDNGSEVSSKKLEGNGDDDKVQITNEQLNEYTPAEIKNGIKKEVIEKLPEVGKIVIETPNLDGSISLRGAVFNDLQLVKYRQDLDKNSPEVVLLSNEDGKIYVADFGWVSADKSISLPDYKTVWTTDSYKLTVEKPVTLTWRSKQGITFKQTISVDENYMFNIQQSIVNNTGRTIAIAPYGRIKQQMTENKKGVFILHEGALGVLNGVLEEYKYKKLRNEEKIEIEAKDGWFGLGSKYWLTAIAPDKNNRFNVDFEYDNEIYKTSYIGKELIINPSQNISISNNFFAGAKEVKLLDKYSEELDIPLFDRAVDFGWFYFLTKPIYLLLKVLYKFVGNFGVAIILLTIIIKGLMYPVATKSFVSMAKMRKLQPEMSKLKERYKNDKQRLNQETIALYKREQVNPASGCLPMFIQIPVFFSLYKVLYVTIDMRHAPFFGWMKDLSLADTTSVWNLFGLLPWDAPMLMNIGILPILMSFTMWLQQRLNPQPQDATQASVIKWMPFIFLFLFAGFPTGLLIYWISSNILSIIQQGMINKKIEKMK